jgi:hypothetical protein
MILFKLAIDKDLATLSSKAAEIVKSEFTLLPLSANLSKYNDDYLTKNKDCARKTISGLKVRKLLSPDHLAAIEKDLVNVLEAPTITFEVAKEAFELMSLWKSGEVEAFRLKAAIQWPNASIFAKAA